MLHPQPLKRGNLRLIVAKEETSVVIAYTNPLHGTLTIVPAPAAPGVIPGVVEISRDYAPRNPPPDLQLRFGQMLGIFKLDEAIKVGNRH